MYIANRKLFIARKPQSKFLTPHACPAPFSCYLCFCAQVCVTLLRMVPEVSIICFALRIYYRSLGCRLVSLKDNLYQFIFYKTLFSAMALSYALQPFVRKSHKHLYQGKMLESPRFEFAC